MEVGLLQSNLPLISIYVSACFTSECVFVYLLSYLSLKMATPRMDMTLAELQEMAARQQQQIEAQQQLLASKVCREVQRQV